MALFNGVALITGAASDIGRSIAVSFAASGCRRIALLDADEDGLTETSRLCRAAASTARTYSIPCDVRSASDVQAGVDCVVEEWGRVDYAVHCAGFRAHLEAPSHVLPPSAFDDVTAGLYRGTWLSARASLVQMIRQNPLPTHDGRPGNRGVVVNVAEGFGVSRGVNSAYAGSQAAIVSLTKSDAYDYAEYNIRVNCVCHGLIETTKNPHSNTEALVARTPLRRMGKPQEVSDAVLFLCSSHASFVHGAVLCVDGGLS